MSPNMTDAAHSHRPREASPLHLLPEGSKYGTASFTASAIPLPVRTDVQMQNAWRVSRLRGCSVHILRR